MFQFHTQQKSCDRGWLNKCKNVPLVSSDALATYSTEMTKLARRLLGFMAADIGDEKEELVEAFTGKRQSMAMHYYPPCPHPDKVLGITPHTDGLGLTLLLHVDDTPGL